MPVAITAAHETLPEDEYIEKAVHYCEKIIDNAKDEQWGVLYFAAKTYCDLYELTDAKDYLEKAYQVSLNCANYLLDEQRELVRVYVDNIKKVEIPKGSSKEKSEEIRNYNKMLTEKRKKELPPVYEPLLIDCELLFSIAKELDIDEKEKSRIDSILRGEDNTIIPVIPIDNLYSFDSGEGNTEDEIDIRFTGDSVWIPVQYVTEQSMISASISAASISGFYDDWELSEVKREKAGDITTYYAIYKSAEATKVTYSEGDAINIRINVREDCNIPTIHAAFKARSKKAFGWLDRFEWLDNASSFSDSIIFEREAEE